MPDPSKLYTKDEINYLINNYANTSNEELSVILNRSINSIKHKAKKLSLNKSVVYRVELKNNFIKNYRKKNVRDLSLNSLKKIALKYKTKTEFRNNDGYAYNICLKQKILNDVCSHMFNKKFSTPQLLLFEILKIIIPNTNISYNDRKIIKPYEIDIYIEKYKLGFEYNGMFWHKFKNSVKNDLIKQTKCIENNVNLIIINEKSYNYVSDIKNQLIENLNNINKLTGLSIFPDNIKSINENNLFN